MGAIAMQNKNISGWYGKTFLIDDLHALATQHNDDFRKVVNMERVIRVILPCGNVQGEVAIFKN